MWRLFPFLPEVLLVEIYLDNAATSYPKPECVYRAVEEFMRGVGASAGRGGYRRALEADRVVYAARRAVSTLLGVEDPKRVVFTANATASLNLALKGLLGEGDVVITSSWEHNAVWRTLKWLERARGVQVRVVPPGGAGPFDLTVFREWLRERPRLVVVTGASNVTGVLLPVPEIGELCRVQGVPLLLDAAQTAGAVPVDVAELGVCLLAFTGHKGLLGPQGTGGLYIGEGVEPEPLKHGGTGSESAREDQPRSLPDRYEAGTLNVPGLAGLGAGVEFLLEQGVERVGRREAELAAHLAEGLRSIPGVAVYGHDGGPHVGVVSFNVEGVPCEEVAYVLDRVYGIMVRAGLHCAPCAHRVLGTLATGTVRASFGYYSGESDVSALLEAVREIAGRVRGGGGLGQGLRGGG